MNLTITSDTIQKLETLQSEKKFIANGLYSGAPDEIIRLRCEAGINALLGEIVANIQQNPQKDFVMDEFMKALSGFEDDDTEEQEQVCEYLEQIMTILNIESSDGKINNWLYGFDPNE